ncbi:MAG: Rho-binding antiterminator [Gammaproteobacteria bacterium]
MISCANHDYVEIACMYRFEIKLVFKNGQIVQGIAFQTTYNENREECMVLKTEKGSEEIVLKQIALMEAVTKNPHFEKIDFG